MTNEQEIRAAAVTAVFGHLNVPINWDGREQGGSLMNWPGVSDCLREVEQYIRDGLDGPVAPFMTTATLREQQGH